MESAKGDIGFAILMLFVCTICVGIGWQVGRNDAKAKVSPPPKGLVHRAANDFACVPMRSQEFIDVGMEVWACGRWVK